MRVNLAIEFDSLQEARAKAERAASSPSALAAAPPRHWTEDPRLLNGLGQFATMLGSFAQQMLAECSVTLKAQCPGCGLENEESVDVHAEAVTVACAGCGAIFECVKPPTGSDAHPPTTAAGEGPAEQAAGEQTSSALPGEHVA